MRIDNQSGQTISNLVISGNCKPRRVPDLQKATKWSAKVPHWGEAQMSFEFDLNGKHFLTSSGAYIEGGTFYRLGFLVGSNGNVAPDLFQWEQEDKWFDTNGPVTSLIDSDLF